MPLPADPPAITPRLGFWLPITIDDRDKKLSDFWDRLRDHVPQGAYIDLSPEFASLQDKDRFYRSGRIGFSWQTLPVQMAIELHQEYATLDTVITLSGTKKAPAGKKNSAAAGVFDALAIFDRVAQDRFEKISAGRNPKVAEHQGDFKDAYTKIYKDSWQAFYTEILHTPISQYGEALGEVLLDSRGLIVSRPAGQKFFAQPHFISPPGVQLPTQKNRAAAPFTDRESLQLAHSLLPFMASGVPDKEHTISRVAQGSVLHASALGAQAPATGESGEKNKIYTVTTLLLAKRGNRHELGHLIDTTNSAGMVRMAALYDLLTIIEAGRKLAAMEKGGVEVLAKKISGAIGGEAADNRQLLQDLFANMRELDIISQGVPGGLPNRVTYSLAYQRRFEQLVEQFGLGRQGRIEGFMPYDEFVRRRLGSSFAFVGTVGGQYDRINQTLSDIRQQLQAAEGLQRTGAVVR